MLNKSFGMLDCTSHIRWLQILSGHLWKISQLLAIFLHTAMVLSLGWILECSPRKSKNKSVYCHAFSNCSQLQLVSVVVQFAEHHSHSKLRKSLYVSLNYVYWFCLARALVKVSELWTLWFLYNFLCRASSGLSSLVVFPLSHWSLSVYVTYLS